MGSEHDPEVRGVYMHLSDKLRVMRQKLRILPWVYNTVIGSEWLREQILTILLFTRSVRKSRWISFEDRQQTSGNY